MKYLIIVKATKDSEAGVMPSEKLMAEMIGFHEEMAKAGVLVDGAGLRPSKDAWRVKYAKSGQRSVVDGPFAETKELVAGYWILECKSKEEAVEWIKRCPNPHEDEGEVELRQLFELEDFGESAAVDHHRRLQAEMDKG